MRTNTAAAMSWRALRMAVLLALVLLMPRPVSAAEGLSGFLAGIDLSRLFPGADHVGPVQGTPPVVPAYDGDRLLGYVFLNSDVVNAVGYSGKPIRVLVGLRLDGTIAGARMVEHHEPIVLVGIPEARIQAVIDGYAGRSVLTDVSEAGAGGVVDVVSGATVTVMVIGDSILRSARKIAHAKGIGAGGEASGISAPPASRSVSLDPGTLRSWSELTGDGSVRRLHLGVGEINDAFSRSGNAEAAARPEPGSPDDTFIDLYTTLVSVPEIGRSLLGEAGYRTLASELKPGQQAVLIAGTGRYSFKGSGYVRGGIFDRIELIQGENGIRFRDRNHRRIGRLAVGDAPEFPEIAVFRIPEGAAFDPVEPWLLRLLVQRSIGARDKAFLTFDAPYALPDRHIRTERRAVTAAVTEGAPTEAVPAPVMDDEDASRAALWQRMWRESRVDLVILSAALITLTGIFFFQHQLVRRPRAYGALRTAFLVFTLGWLGWWVAAQLSVVNVLVFVNALRTDFSWGYFLMSPLVFVLWFAVAAALLFWARGAFCGWLCPFGALQELTNRLGRRLGIRQIRVPWGLHERLWPIKYILFLGLFGLSLSSLADAERLAEIEPFKTAIVLHFVRDWPFVAFAAGLLAANLFIERFFCRYLCPLGAALAIPARLRMFDWLRRYRQCGNPCQRCAGECPVQCIHPEGHINVNECISCLHCQVLYHHEYKCPVKIEKRQKRERREAAASAPPNPTSAM